MMRICGLVNFALLAFLAVQSEFSFAQEAADDEGFIEPEVNVYQFPEYPKEAIDKDLTGWVYLQFMVDTNGRAYDVILVDSSGEKSFESAAMRAAQQTSYFPATMNGNPVIARDTRVVEFTIEGTAQGPSPRFFERYGSLQKLISDGKQRAAERSIRRLRQTSRTRFENSWLGIADYTFEKRWGTKQSQLDALNRAIAYVATSHYLSADTFESALISKFLLEVNLKYFKTALSTLEKLQRQEVVDDEVLAGLQTYVEQIERLRNNQTPFSVGYEFPANRNWEYDLLWNSFSLRTVSGNASSLTVLCDRGTKQLTFEREVTHEMDGDVGNCSVYVHGSQGDEVLLSQIKMSQK